MATIGVIGGGVVGVSCALHLRRDGHDVVLFERDRIAAGASFGNAGILSSGGCVPLGMPGVIGRIPGMLLDPHGPLVIRWHYLVRLFPWLVRLLRSSSTSSVERISIALASLMAGADEAYRDLLNEDYARFVAQKGLLFPYKNTASFEAGAAARDLRRRRGVSFHVLDTDEIRQLEPALSTDHHKAIYFPDARHALDPEQLTTHVSALFEREGGEIVRAEVCRLEPGRGSRPAIRLKAGSRLFEKIVVAAGAWSKALARPAGARVPLDTERGYHAMLPSPGVTVRVPIISGDHSIAITPMATGLRISGTVEFAGLNAPADFGRADRMVEIAERLLPGLRRDGLTRWLGFRPSLPDSMPVIGPSASDPNILFAFGHGHLGVTYGAITGRLVADMVRDRKPSIDLAPFSPRRFGLTPFL